MGEVPRAPEAKLLALPSVDAEALASWKGRNLAPNSEASTVFLQNISKFQAGDRAATRKLHW